MVRPTAEGALVAAVDGIGHGPPAATAARRAIALLAEGDPLRPLDALRRCHERLRDTRGAVMSLAWFDRARDTMEWLGVGNVEGVLLRAGRRGPAGRESLLLQGGVVGRLLPALHAGSLAVSAGDVLVLATDGVQSRFAREIAPEATPEATARAVLARYGIGPDDALVLAVRYRGGAP